MPNGKLYHKSCIHRHNEHFEIDFSEDLTIVKKSSTETEEKHKPCVYESKDFKTDLEDNDTLIPEISYYSDWSHYAQSVNKDGITYMKSKFTVPKAPKSTSPIGLASVYIFNGLEDGGGVHGQASLILQPVLQYGKSGCLNDPLLWHEWHFTSYLVDGNGHAHCGKVIKVNEGQVLEGIMEMTDASSNVWKVTSNVVGSDIVSVYSASLGSALIDSAYVTMEGMLVYNCNHYPPNDIVSFYDIEVKDKSGGLNLNKWEPKVRHNECNQKVRINDAKSVDLIYESNL